MAKRILYPRNDGKWGWRLEADDGRIIATDGGPGFDRESDARDTADKIIGGHFKDAIEDISPRGVEPGPAPGT